MAGPLNRDNIYQFLDEGYTLVSGLISREIAARADAAAFRCNGIDPEDAATWPNAVENEFFTDPDLMAVYTPELLQAAAQLCDNPTMIGAMRPLESAFVIKLIPTDEEWQPSGMHMDGGGASQMLQFTPPQWQMFAMVYLHDIERHGGGTVVWPRSHRKLQALARSDTARYRFMPQLAKDLHLVDPGDYIELTPRAGDVLFIHPMILHAKPMNVGPRPRFAMHIKW